ncbi:MAG: hypothetical protein ACM3S1_06110 [Hyphomicrobiales bacterium]
MSAPVLVLVPAGAVDFDGAPGTYVERYATAAGAAQALASGTFAAAVILSDGLDAPGAETVAAAVRAAGRPVIEVRSGPWDGATHSPLSGACRGVISGFGANGLHAAAALLLSEAAAARG